MGFAELFIIALSLSMDAFAVAICKGLNMSKINYRHAGIIALFFGAFQAIMPLFGWLLGIRFDHYIVGYDHWVAFFLLGFIGWRMVYDGIHGEAEEKDCDADVLDIKELLILSIATSIDALAVGITFAILPNTNIWTSITTIGITTFAISFAGVLIGNRFGVKYKSKAELFGGVALFLIGLKILLEHLGVISF